MKEKYPAIEVGIIRFMTNRDTQFLIRCIDQYKYSYSLSRKLIPNHRPGYIKVVKDLYNYLVNLSTYQMLMDAHNDRAFEYLRICSDIYDRLPEWAKWKGDIHG